MRTILSVALMSTLANIVSCTNGPNTVQINWSQHTVLPGIDGKPSLGYAGPVTGFIADTIIVAGGANFPDSMPWLGGKKKYYNEVYIYVKKDTGLQYLYQQALPDTIAYPAVCSTPHGVVYAGGENQHELSKKVWLIGVNQKDSLGFTLLPDLPEATSNGSMTLLNNHLYFAGGETASGVSAKFYALNLASRESGWAVLPDLPKPASHGLLLAQSGKLFFVGGRMKTQSGISELYASVYVYDFTSGQWGNRKSLPYVLSAGTGVAYQTDNLLLFGGDKGETFRKTEELIAAIANENDSVKKAALVQQKNTVQSTHPGFSREVLMYNTEKDEWIVAGSIPFAVPVTTTAFVTGNTVFIPSGEIRAGVRLPQIIMGIFNQ